MTNHFPILIIILPLMTAFFILLFKKHRIILSMISIVVSLIFLSMLSSEILHGHKIMYHLGNWPGPLGISLLIDGLSFFFSIMVLSIGLLIIAYSIPEKKYDETYYFLLLISLSSMLGIIYTTDIFNMYVLYELLTIATYLLISYYKKGVALRASFNYLIMGGVGLSFFLLGVGFLYVITGTLDMQYMVKQLSIASNSSQQIVIMPFVLIVTGIGIKIAMFPLHGWLPDAHALAPSSVSALLSGVTVKVGIYCLIRLVYGLFREVKYLHSSQIILMILGVITLLFGATMALAQKDLKRLLAYSTINQLGIILIGLSVRTETGLNGALFHILNHAILKSTLFFCAGIMIAKTGSGKLKELSGFGRENLWISWIFIIASLGMIGIPPMNGFVSKFLICLAAVDAGYSFLAVIILTASMITAAYYFRIIQIFFSTSMKPNFIISCEKEKIISGEKYFKVWTIYILTGLSLLLGIYPALGLLFTKPAAVLFLFGTTR